MNFTIYKITSGEIIQSGTCPDDDFSLQQIPDGCAIINLSSNINSQYIENEAAVDKPAKPNEWCIFDYNSKEWILSAEIAKQNAIRQRNTFLYQSDWTQIPNNPLIEIKRQEWANYRQQLRDITLQSGYPFNIIWPIQPE